MSFHIDFPVVGGVESAGMPQVRHTSRCMIPFFDSILQSRFRRSLARRPSLFRPGNNACSRGQSGALVRWGSSPVVPGFARWRPGDLSPRRTRKSRFCRSSSMCVLVSRLRNTRTVVLSPVKTSRLPWKTYAKRNTASLKSLRQGCRQSALEPATCSPSLLHTTKK